MLNFGLVAFKTYKNDYSRKIDSGMSGGGGGDSKKYKIIKSLSLEKNQFIYFI